MNQLPDSLLFLQSPRFWAVVFNAATLYLQQKGWIGTAELALVTAIVAPYVTIRTVDRHTDKMSDAVGSTPVSDVPSSSAWYGSGAPEAQPTPEV